MKYTTLIAAAMVVLAVACKSTKTTTDTAKKETTATPTVSADIAAAGEKRYPGINIADLTEGQTLFYSKCGNCHGLPEPDSEKEEKWPKIMDHMAPKSKLDDVQKEKVLRYILCAADVKKAK